MKEIRKINNEIEILTSNLDLKNKTILDIGCGTGKLTRLLSEYCSEIYGIDAPELVELAGKTAFPANVKFLPGTAQNLPCENDFADLVIYFASFHHIPEKEMGTALKECSRVLKTGGLVCFVEPLARNGSYFELAKLVEDEHDIQMTAYKMIESLSNKGYSSLCELFYYIERSFRDFEKYVNVYIIDEKMKEDILDKAVKVIRDKNIRPDDTAFQSHIRLNILAKE